MSFLGEYKWSVFHQNIRRNTPLSTRKLAIKSPSFQFLRQVGQKSLERTLRQICLSVVLDKISFIRTCWWAQAAAIILSFPPPRTGCGEGRSKRMFSLPSFYFCNPLCFKLAGKAAETIARISKNSRQLKQTFSHTRKTPKNEAVDNYYLSTTNNLGFSCRQLAPQTTFCSCR